MEAELVDKVTRAELLQFFSEEDTQKFLSSLEKKEIAKDETLENKGEPQKSVYIVEEGTLVKTKRDGRTTILGRGDITGLLHFFSHDPAAADIKAGEKGATVWTTTGEIFHELLKAHPTLSSSYIKFLNKKVRKSLNSISNLSSQSGTRIAFFDSKPYMKNVFTKVNKSKGYDYSFTWFEVKLNKDTAQFASGHEIVCIFVNDKADEETINVLNQVGVKMIALRCAGYNNVDLKAIEKNKISLTRVPAYSPYAVAEFAIALMLNLNRKVHKSYNRVRESNFELNNLVGFDMHSKTVGIFGTGKIGVCTANILLGFGCKIIAVDKYENDELKKKGVKYVKQEELLKESDIITLHAPLLESTKHWLNAETLKTVKKGVHIINTSRGPLIDTVALYDAIIDGRVGAAGLDVIEGEEKLFFENMESELVKDQTISKIVALPNVILTSHQAFLTEDALNAIAESTLSSIKEFVSGKKGDQLTNVVKQEY